MKGEHTSPPAGRSDGSKPVIFRTRGWLRYTVLVAIAFWVLVLLALVTMHGPKAQGFVGAAFFIALFTTLSVFYNSTCVEVTRDSVILRGVLSFRLVRFNEILKVDVVPGLLQTTYAVRARRGFLSFTSLIADHQRLLQLIVERAQLSPA